VVVVLAIVLAVVLWVRLLGPDAVSFGASEKRLSLVSTVSGSLADVRSDRPGLRVLFIGNSLTYVNDMPAMVERLAQEDRGARRVFAVRYAPAGWRLEWAARDEGLMKLIADERWDAVVLQEQSAIPSLPGYREAHMYPAARALAGAASRSGAETVLFMTWGYREGDRYEYSRDDYGAMQARVADAYTRLGGELHSLVAPVGLAWQTALSERPRTALWEIDGRHPSVIGSYLAACVMYRDIAARDPRGSRFTAGLAPGVARWLRRVAVEAVEAGHVKRRGVRGPNAAGRPTAR
jgi:hypothetical protein